MSTTTRTPRPRQRRPRARRLGFAAAVAVGALLGLAGPAHAQDDGDAPVDGDTEAPATEVRGTLRATDEDGEDIFLEGVELVVTAADGTEIGLAVSDAEGNWSLGLPGAGEYSTLLREETLPEGVVLRNPG